MGLPLADHHVGIAGGAGQEHDVRDVVGFPFLGLVSAALAKSTSRIWARNGIRANWILWSRQGWLMTSPVVIDAKPGDARGVIEQIDKQAPVRYTQVSPAS